MLRLILLINYITKLTEFNKRDNTEAVALKNFKISLVKINGGGLEIFTKALY